MGRNLRIFRRVAAEFTFNRPKLGVPFWNCMIATLIRNPRAMEFTTMSIVMYLHVARFMDFVIRDMNRRIAEIDAGRDPIVPRQRGPEFAIGQHDAKAA